MKKVIKKFIMLCMIVFLTTGCLKYNVSMEVKSNKNVNLELIYALGMDASDYEEAQKEKEETECGEDEYCSEDDGMSMEIDKEDYKELLKYGYKVEFDFTKFLNQDDGYKDVPVMFYKDGDNYIADFMFNFASEEEGTDTESLISEEEMQELIDSMDMKYTITLPQEPKSHNATEVSKDGKTLTWKLQYGKKNEVNFEFELGTNPMWYFIIIGGIVVAVLLIGGVVVSMTNSKKYATMLDQQMSGIVPDNNVVPPMFDNQPVPQQPVVQQPVMEQPMVQQMPQQPMQPQQMPQQQFIQQQPMVDNQSFGAQNNNFPN